MPLYFHKINKKSDLFQSQNTAFLLENNWDDFCFKSLFYLVVFDENGIQHDIGNVKIGYLNQEKEQDLWTSSKIPEGQFEKLEDNFFSLGQDSEYYKNINDNLSSELISLLLNGLRDVVQNNNLLASVEKEKVFQVSLLRNVSLSAIHEQYKRILKGEAILTEFNFLYHKLKTEKEGEIKLDFHVKPNSKPSTNIHILIGRNGVGKTTILNKMVNSIVNIDSTTEEFGRFYPNQFRKQNHISQDYFSSVVSISFSAFDPFIPPPDQVDKSKGICYYYVGLKSEKCSKNPKLKNNMELCDDFVKSLAVCFSLSAKKERWLKSIKKLESDNNFADMQLSQLANIDEFKEKSESLFKRMSSGHAIVLLSMTKLIETVEEKTLVLIDEPESHLHPPLLSAFTRALSDLLMNRNGVAIIATHSPVVLQEVPKSCVYKLRRTGLVTRAERPESETFGENVGVLTRDVFGLEVSKSGFNELLEQSVADGKSYEEILNDYNHQLGFEGKAILRALIARRND